MTDLQEPFVQTNAPVDLIDAPGWVSKFVEFERASWQAAFDGGIIRSVDSSTHSLVSMVVRDALRMSACEFVSAVESVYESLRERLDSLACGSPVRMWNYVPGILDPIGDVPSRYQLLNQARYDVYCRWYGSPEGFQDHVVTATCTGHAGNDYIFHCLCAPVPGVAVENPRQCASYRYSKRYGAKPPCFARATSLSAGQTGRRQIMVGGTASVSGEDSRYQDDLSRQLDETFRNMSSILAASSASPSDGSQALSLGAYSDIRIYYKNQNDRHQIEDAVSRRFSADVTTEWIHAPICRDELLVEIEGLALVSD